MSDGSNVSLSHEELQAAAGDIRTRKDELKRFLQQASTTVEQVTGRAYKTRTASNEFRTAHNDWNQATGQLVESLGQVADGLEQTRQIDEQTDQQARARVGDIRGGGGGGTARTAVAVGSGVAAGGGAVAGAAAAVRNSRSASTAGGGAAGGAAGGGGTGGGGSSAGGGGTGGGGSAGRGGAGGGGGGGGGSGSGRSGRGGASGPRRPSGRSPRGGNWRTVNDKMLPANREPLERMTRSRGTRGETYWTDKQDRRAGMEARVTPAHLGTGTGVQSGILPTRAGLDRSHLWARDHGGPGDDLRNLGWFYSKVNRGEMAVIERRISDFVLEQGRPVTLSVIPRYGSDRTTVADDILIGVRTDDGKGFTVLIPKP